MFFLYNAEKYGTVFIISNIVLSEGIFMLHYGDVLFDFVDIMNLENGKFQKLVDGIRTLEDRDPIIINESNINDAFDFLYCNNFSFFMHVTINNSIIKDQMIQLPMIDNRYQFTEADFKASVWDTAILDAVPSILLLYKVLIDDPMTVYYSANTLAECYRTEFEHAKLFKHLISSFHQLKKNFAQEDNIFNK